MLTPRRADLEAKLPPVTPDQLESFEVAVRAFEELVGPGADQEAWPELTAELKLQLDKIWALQEQVRERDWPRPVCLGCRGITMYWPGTDIAPGWVGCGVCMTSGVDLRPEFKRPALHPGRGRRLLAD